MRIPQESIEVEAHNAWESGDQKRAFALFKEGAAFGLVGCMLDLGYFYDEGLGARKNKVEAMYWYKRAYRKGSAAAASNIALLYKEQGRYHLAFQWFYRATLLGDGDAEVDLAKLYMQGKGVRRSLILARGCLLTALSSKYITESGREEATELICRLESAL